MRPLVRPMTNVDRFIATSMRIDALPDSFTLEQVRQLVGQALEHSVDRQSDLDEERIRNLRTALLQIEQTTSDTVAAIAARCARITDDD